MMTQLRFRGHCVVPRLAMRSLRGRGLRREKSVHRLGRAEVTGTIAAQ